MGIHFKSPGIHDSWDKWLTQKELLEIHKKEKNATAMEVNIASAMLKDINKGEFKTAEILLSRRFGFPKQQMEHTGEMVTSYEIVAASEHKKETPGQWYLPSAIWQQVKVSNRLWWVWKR